MSLLVRLACSNYYGVIFKILTGQKRDLTELKFLWPVNTTGNSPIPANSHACGLKTSMSRWLTFAGQFLTPD